MNWKDKSVLVTGGTGSFGRKFVRIMLEEKHPNKIIVLSRDELKQHEMRTSGFNDESLRYFIGDVRDVRRLRRAFQDVDIGNTFCNHYLPNIGCGGFIVAHYHKHGIGR